MSEIKIKEVMEEIYHKLQDGDTRLSEEQAETYREIVLKLWKSTEDEVPFELGNIDAEIISMLGFFESAVIRGNLKTANQMCIRDRKKRHQCTASAWKMPGICGPCTEVT